MSRRMSSPVKPGKLSESGKLSEPAKPVKRPARHH